MDLDCMNRGDGMESGMKIKSPQISIIVPVYNTVAYLDKCLNSILNQTYDSLEVICVDDGSTDGSADIVAKYENQDSRVKVIYQPNGGESNARNKGLQAATGDFIGFVDGDDWLELDMYEKLYELICKDESDLAAVGYFIDKDNNVSYYEGINEGTIAYKKAGSEGFGYDPIFVIPEFNKTEAELGADYKDENSHRARALKKWIIDAKDRL